MKSIDALLRKSPDFDPSDSEGKVEVVASEESMRLSGRVEIVALEESMRLSGGDKEYKPVYDELEADEHFRFGSSSVFNFFDNLF